MTGKKWKLAVGWRFVSMPMGDRVLASLGIFSHVMKAKKDLPNFESWLVILPLLGSIFTMLRWGMWRWPQVARLLKEDDIVLFMFTLMLS